MFGIFSVNAACMGFNPLIINYTRKSLHVSSYPLITEIRRNVIYQIHYTLSRNIISHWTILTLNEKETMYLQQSECYKWILLCSLTCEATGLSILPLQRLYHMGVCCRTHSSVWGWHINTISETKLLTFLPPRVLSINDDEDKLIRNFN